MAREAKTSAPDGSREHRARVLAALGDPTRLGVLDLLAVQDLSPDSLAAALGISGNLLAHHLNVLEANGLVRRTHSQHDRRRTYVRAVDGSRDGLLPTPGSVTAPRVVFICTHNSARSVLAEALWRGASDVPSTSAGTRPAQEVNSRARQAADRVGLSLSNHVPQHIDAVLRPGDLVISVCDGVNEELEPMTNPRVHWSIPDPTIVGTDAAFDAAIAELRHRVVRLAPRVNRPARPRHRRATR